MSVLGVPLAPETEALVAGLVFAARRRVNMLPVVDGVRAEDKGHNGMIAWAWFYWVRNRVAHDRPTIEWFTPEKAPSRAKPTTCAGDGA